MLPEMRCLLISKKFSPTSDIKNYPKNPDFLSTVSHELRAPLATVREGLSQIQRGLLGKVNRRQKAMMSLMLDEVDRLYRIVNDLLDISKIEQGGLVLQKEVFGLGELVKSIADQSKAKTPSFFGYFFGYSLPILIPIFWIIWFFFFRTS